MRLGTCGVERMAPIRERASLPDRTSTPCATAAGLTAVEALLKDKGKPRRTLEVVAICEEEGSRFATNFWGSRAIVGAIDQPDTAMAAAMRERGLDPATVASAARDDID